MRGEENRDVTKAPVALTGATGFLGSAVLDHLLPRRPVRALVRDPAGLVGDSRAAVVQGDLADKDALLRLVDGAEVLIHAASYVGTDPERQREVNVVGTQRLVEEAVASGVSRLVLISTAGVYGGDLGPGRAEDDGSARPRSSLSASRLEAENIVLRAGGVVVRPHLVHGRGDRWFLSTLLAATERLGGWIGNPDARLSVIGRRRLGAMVVRLALANSEPGIFHAAEPEPMTVRQLVEPVLRLARVAPPNRSLSVDEASELLAPVGVARSQIELIAHDSWFSTAKIWAAIGESTLNAGLPPMELPENVAWYASRLQTTRSGESPAP